MVCFGGVENKLIILFDSENASFLKKMKSPISSVRLTSNAEWQLLQNSARVQSVAEVMTLWLSNVWITNIADKKNK